MPYGWRDVQLGDVGVIVDWGKKSLPDDQVPVTHAIFADTNPHVGEASVRAAVNLQLPDTSAKNGGDDNDNYIYIVFPGSYLTPAQNPPHWPDASIQATALALFQKMGGVAALRRIFS